MATVVHIKTNPRYNERVNGVILSFSGIKLKGDDNTGQVLSGFKKAMVTH